MSSITAGTTSTTTLVHSGDTTGSLVFKTNDTGSGGTTAVTIDTSQNVGIGTASPVSKLNVNGGSVTLAETTTGAYNIDFQSRTASTNARIQYDQVTNSTGQLLFYTNGGSLTERMRIDSSGNLLVGVTSTFSPGGVPTTTSVSTGTAGNWALGIRNTSSASNPFGLAVNYPNGAPNSGGAQFIFCSDNVGTKFEVRSNGGIANYSANNANLSDQREKKNIELAPNYLDKICQIPVKTFLLNDQTDEDLNLGVIAQDVQAICPELVTESNWGSEEEPKMRLSIYQTDLQYALMKSIQELKAINDQQAETINALTARVVALEGK